MMKASKFILSVLGVALVCWNAPVAHAWCDPIELVCGDTISGTSRYGHDDVATYNCLPDTNYNGKADVYRVYASFDSMLIQLDWDAPNADRLRMFVLYNCNQDHCIATDANFLALDVTPGEDYWIIVDAKRDHNDDNFVPYTLTVICSDHPLPVELTSFAAVPSTDGVNLTWSVASELNNDRFEIEREQPGVTPWEHVGVLAGRGTSQTAYTYTFMDRNVAPETAYTYRLYSVSVNGEREAIGHASVNSGGLAQPTIATGFKLIGNYPNPFNPSTTIHFDVAEVMTLSLDVYDLNGRLMTTLASGEFESGSYDYAFDADAYPSGVYFARLSGTAESQLLKLVLMK